MAPLVEILSGTMTMLHGEYGILHKIAEGRFDDDFVVVSPGDKVPTNAFLKNHPAHQAEHKTGDRT